MKFVMLLLVSVLSLSVSCYLNKKTSCSTLRVIECYGVEGSSSQVADEFEKKYLCMEIAMHRLLMLSGSRLYRNKHGGHSYFGLDLYSDNIFPEIGECVSILVSHSYDTTEIEKWTVFSRRTLWVMSKRNKNLQFIVSMLINDAYMSPDRDVQCKLQNFFIDYSGDSWGKIMQGVREHKLPFEAQLPIELRDIVHKGCCCCSDGLPLAAVRQDELSVYIRLEAWKTIASG